MALFEKIFSGHIVVRRLLLVFIVCVMSWLDIITGYEYSFSIFYLIPIAISAWYDSKNITITTVFVAACTWLFSDIASGHHYTDIITPYWNAGVRLVFFSVVALLILRVRENWEEMSQMAMLDNLTQLNNSRALSLEYKQLRKQNLKSHQSIAIGLIDLDGFKAVNDQLGHSVGDDVLIEFARVLKNTTRKTDIVARMGGDEFIVILKNTDPDGAKEYEKRLIESFYKSHLKDQFGVDFSMGISIFDDLPDNIDDATYQADQLMYHSKEMGKSQTTIQMVYSS